MRPVSLCRSGWPGAHRGPLVPAPECWLVFEACPATLALIFTILNYVYADVSGREYVLVSGSRCLRRSEESEPLELELVGVGS